MKRYKLYFEFYGKKMSTTIFADNEFMAKNQVRNRINFLKIEEIGNDIFKNFSDIWK